MGKKKQAFYRIVAADSRFPRDGRFLEVVADRMDVKLTDLGDIAKRATDPAIISSMCVVFAETEPL